MKEKRNLKTSLAIVIIIITSTFYGCTTRENNNISTNDKDVNTSQLYSEPGSMPIVNEEITLSIFAPDDGENNRSENAQTIELEEKTGIKIQWQIAPNADIKSKMNLMFASGDVTDIIMTGVSKNSRLDKSSEALLGAQGLILPLNEYYDTISVGYKRAFEELDGMREYITTPDGNIYNMPNVDGSLHVQFNNKLWLNTKWLNNLELEIPKTIDEFYEVMKAFKEKDANGNGDVNDEIPLSTVISGAGTQIDGFLMNPFQLTPEVNKLYVDNGKIIFAPTQDKYKEGLINPESFTQDKNNQVNINENGDYTVIGAFLAQRPGYAADLTSEPNSKKWEQYQSIPPLEGNDGTAISAWSPYAMYQTGMTFISSASRYPEAAFRLIDGLATHEGMLRTAAGIEGTHWRKANEGELGLDGLQAELTSIPGSDTTGQTWNQLSGLVRLPKDTVSSTTNQDPYSDDVKPLAGRQVLMYKSSLDHEKVKQPLESVLPDLYQSLDAAEEMALVKTNVMDYQNDALVRFITGDINIDDGWENYLSQLNSVGLDRYIELLQVAYDESAFSN
ncbi:MAG: extracellular solute-binding protein [Lachnospirales bacterium]